MQGYQKLESEKKLCLLHPSFLASVFKDNQFPAPPFPVYLSVCFSFSLSVSHSLSHSIFYARVGALLFSILLLIWQSILVHSCVPSLPFLCFGGVLPCRLA